MMIEFSILPVGEESHIGKYIAAAVKMFTRAAWNIA